MKKAYYVFLVLTILIAIPFIISFFPSAPSASVHRDPSGFGVGYGAAIKSLVTDVIRVTFGIFAVITVLLRLALLPNK